VQFSRSFLDTAHQTPVFDILLRALIALAVLGMACALLTSYYISVRLTNIIGMTCLLVWINGFLCLRRGVRAARYYVIAWSALILGITILSLKNFGILPHNAFTVWAPQLGSATEITLLSLGLADRIRTLRLLPLNNLEHLGALRDGVVFSEQNLQVNAMHRRCLLCRRSLLQLVIVFPRHQRNHKPQLLHPWAFSSIDRVDLYAENTPARVC